MRILIACLLFALSLPAFADGTEALFVVQFTIGDAWVTEKAPHEQAYFAFSPFYEGCVERPK